MTESDIVASIKTEVRKTINGFDIKVIKREFSSISKYIATIAVIAKNSEIQTQTLSDVINYFVEHGDDRVRINGTQRELKDLDFEILIIEAEVNLI